MKACLALIIAIILSSCDKWGNNRYFIGDLTTVRNSAQIQNLQGEQVILDGGITYKFFSVYDSLLLFWNNELPDHKSFGVFNLNNRKHVANYVHTGRGPHESFVGPISQLHVEKGELTTLLNAPNEDEFRIWNISKSINNGTTVYDTIVHYSGKGRTGHYYLNLFYNVRDSSLIAYLPRDTEHYPVPRFEKIHCPSYNAARKYEIYREASEVSDNSINWLYSWNCLKPDGTKMAMLMEYLCQLNILDLGSGEASFYRVENTPGPAIFKTAPSQIPIRFLSAQCDDAYIYGLYSGLPVLDGNNQYVLPEQVYVFDWDGGLVSILNLAHSANQIWLDSANNLLYAFNELNEEIYRYDLESLNADR